MAKPTAIVGIGAATRINAAAEKLIALRLADARKYESRLRGQPDPDDVHDMRVAVRRLRAVLQLVEVPKRVEREVKRLQDALGAVRDIHVQQKWLEEEAKGAHGSEKETIEKLARHVAVSLPSRGQTLHRELRRWVSQTVPLVRAASGRVANEHRLGGGTVRSLLRKRIRRVGVELDTLAVQSDADLAHALRIQVKRLRYLVELLEPVWPEKVSMLLGALQPLQETLGDLHDADVRLQQFSVVAADEPELGPGLRRLIARTEAQRKELEGEVAALALRWRAERAVKSLRRLFAKSEVAAV